MLQNTVQYTIRYVIKYITTLTILVTKLNYINWKIIVIKIRGRQIISAALFSALTRQCFNHGLNGLSL